MLYDRWLRIARERRGEIALHDLAGGGRWTFGQLETLAERTPDDARSAELPRGHSPDFIFAVLRAWRRGRVVAPLEAGQAALDLTGLPSHIAHLKTTSATTGISRGVAFTGAQIASDADNIVATMGLRADWPNLGVISLAHSYGFSNLVTPLLLHGITLVLAASPMPEAVRRALAEWPALTLPAVPAMWRAWHEAEVITPAIRLAISAGAPLPLSLEQAVFAKSGVKIHNFYGSTECGGIAYDSSPEPRRDAACVGAPMQNVTLAMNPNGCLEVHGAAVGETYWPEPGPHLAHGCFRTSDLVELRDGLVFLRGRANDQINVAGRKVSPESIERVLLAHPAVGDCLVFGVPSADEGRGDDVVVFVVPAERVTEDLLRDWLHERVPAWQIPRSWRFVETLVANERGKISRAEWREKHLSDRESRAGQ
jgi:acyl-CoA synthetase (AMP-forming)/AMP-acid ligase II